MPGTAHRTLCSHGPRSEMLACHLCGTALEHSLRPAGNPATPCLFPSRRPAPDDRSSGRRNGGTPSSCRVGESRAKSSCARRSPPRPPPVVTLSSAAADYVVTPPRRPQVIRRGEARRTIAGCNAVRPYAQLRRVVRTATGASRTALFNAQRPGWLNAPSTWRLSLTWPATVPVEHHGVTRRSACASRRVPFRPTSAAGTQDALLR